MGRFGQEEEAVRDGLQVVALWSTFAHTCPSAREEATSFFWGDFMDRRDDPEDWNNLNKQLTGGNRALHTPRASSLRRSVSRPSSPTPPSGSVCACSLSRTARRSLLSVCINDARGYSCVVGSNIMSRNSSDELYSAQRRLLELRG